MSMTVNEPILYIEGLDILAEVVRYMINEGLTSLPYCDMDKFYSKHVCWTCALG